MTLEALEKLATKSGSAKTIINGEEFEVTRMVKSKRSRYGYRHGNRHMGRDEAERLFPTFQYDPAKMFPFATSRHTMTD